MELIIEKGWCVCPTTQDLVEEFRGEAEELANHLMVGLEAPTIEERQEGAEWMDEIESKIFNAWIDFAGNSTDAGSICFTIIKD